MKIETPSGTAHTLAPRQLQRFLRQCVDAGMSSTEIALMSAINSVHMAMISGMSVPEIRLMIDRVIEGAIEQKVHLAPESKTRQ